MRQKKKRLVSVLIVLFGLVSYSFPMVAQAYLDNGTPRLQVQDCGVKEEVEGQPDAPNPVADNNLAATTAAVNTRFSKAAAQADQRPASSKTLAYSNHHDLDSLARLVYGEARGESFVGQVAVAAVVLNRVESGKFGDTINEVIFEPGAFSAVSDGQYYLKPNQEAYKAAQAALNGWDPTGNAIYYWNPVTATNQWVWNRPVITTIGKHVFAL